MLRERGEQVGPEDVGKVMDQWTTTQSTMLGSGYGEQKQQERRAKLERRNCAFAVFHGVALFSTRQSWPTATPTTKSEMPRITWTAACIAATALITTALMATALTAQPTGMYLGASVGAARLRVATFRVQQRQPSLCGRAWLLPAYSGSKLGSPV